MLRMKVDIRRCVEGALKREKEARTKACIKQTLVMLESGDRSRKWPRVAHQPSPSISNTS